MTKELKKLKRINRRENRIAKKNLELAEINKAMHSWNGSDYSFREARRIVRHGIAPFRCDMGYASCEERKYCNGDC